MPRWLKRGTALVMALGVGIATGLAIAHLRDRDHHPLSQSDYARLYAADQTISQICFKGQIGIPATPSAAQRGELRRQIDALVDIIIRNPQYRDYDALHAIESDEPAVDWHGQLWGDQLMLSSCGAPREYAELAFAIEQGGRLGDIPATV